MRKIKITLGLFCLFTASSLTLNAQVKPEILNWYNNSKAGVKTEQAYKKVAGRKSTEVIVAVIDSGVDIEHEDLQGKIWVNAKEIAGNGIDDDKNGYIDDVHGWNFLGNSKGENQNYARLEKTRLIANYEIQFKDVDASTLSGSSKTAYLAYQDLKKEFDAEKAEYVGAYEQLTQIDAQKVMIEGMIAKECGVKNYTIKDLEKWKPESEQGKGLRQLGIMWKDGSMKEQIEQLDQMVNYNYNTAYNDREFVGDVANDFKDVKYGNANVEGPDALHGTHVAGIIASTRNNPLGGNGVAENVKIMVLRAVPNGDEQDKDIALAVRYAVDNGASIINMSFGKAYSPNAQEVYEAFVYADSKGVLLVHAAGNDGKNLDEGKNFPTSMFPMQTVPFKNWLTIGASTRFNSAKKFSFSKKKKANMSKLPATFSNYSQTKVDIFAPGHDIYNAIPQSEYKILAGTSMACPVTSGAAAFLKGYFPTLSMEQIKNALLSSARSYKGKMHFKPGTTELVDFSTLSVTGGVVDLEAAIDKCMEMEKK